MKTQIMYRFIYFLLILAAAIFFAKAFLFAVDNKIDNQDVMLCNSALKSRNAEYLKKCECFYKGEGIRCIHSKEVSNYANWNRLRSI